MKIRDQKLQPKPEPTLTPSEAASRREIGIGAQDNPVVITVTDSPDKADPVITALDKLTQVVDGVAGRIGLIEYRLSTLEGGATGGRHEPSTSQSSCFYPDEPTFGPSTGVRPKVRKPKPLPDIPDDSQGETDKKRKKKAEKHQVTQLSQEEVERLAD